MVLMELWPVSRCLKGHRKHLKRSLDRDSHFQVHLGVELRFLRNLAGPLPGMSYRYDLRKGAAKLQPARAGTVLSHVVVMDETSSARSVVDSETRSGWVLSQYYADREDTMMLTWTSFSPSDTLSTSSRRAALSGFGSRLYAASRIAWSSGLIIVGM